MKTVDGGKTSSVGTAFSNGFGSPSIPHQVTSISAHRKTSWSKRSSTAYCLYLSSATWPANRPACFQVHEACFQVHRRCFRLYEACFPKHGLCFPMHRLCFRVHPTVHNCGHLGPSRSMRRASRSTSRASRCMRHASGCNPLYSIVDTSVLPKALAVLPAARQVRREVPTAARRSLRQEPLQRPPSPLPRDAATRGRRRDRAAGRWHGSGHDLRARRRRRVGGR